MNSNVDGHGAAMHAGGPIRRLKKLEARVRRDAGAQLPKSDVHWQGEAIEAEFTRVQETAEEHALVPAAKRKGRRQALRGMGRVFQRGRVWWISFYHHGKEIRESGETDNEAQARKLLKKRLGDTQHGKFIANEDKVRFDDLAKLIETDYKLNRRRSWESGAKINVKHLRGFFGFDRAIDIEARHKKYQLFRAEQGASIATVNRETSTLRRMFSLAVKAKLLSHRPVFEMLDNEEVRQGFVEHGDFVRLLDGLPLYLRQLVEWLYHTGWRKSAARNLEWTEIDFQSRTARLKSQDSKNREQWVLPLTGRPWELIEERQKERRLDCRYVFHRDGRKIGDFRKAWQTACVAAGLGQFIEQEPVKYAKDRKKRQRKEYMGLIPHDLRRCAARNLSRAGVPEQIAMRITQHKTTSIFRRYNILNEGQLREALEQQQVFLRTQAKKSKVAVARR
jgi:integrase